MAVSDSIELRASLNSLKRVDPYVKNILATATQVALYTFDINQNQWEKGDKEGALFLYSRNGEPFHSIMIFNRLNKDNFIEPITADFDYQVQLPFLLYRSKLKIFGIWFFNTHECNQVATLIESLMEKDQIEDRPLHVDQNGMNVDIFSMLSKAQENFNKTPSKAEGNPSTFMASTPRVPDMASQSVMDFFAKAGTKGANQTPAVTGENVLHRLMSNPAHSVEHIEKQQRSITPQEIFSHTIEQGVFGDRKSVPINFSSGAIRKFEGLEPQTNGLSISNISPPKQNVIASSPLTYLSHNQSSSVPTDEADISGTSPFQKFLQNAQKPLLMTPMMFTAPNPIKESEVSSDEASEPVAMLTEKQLAQALIYLLKNNSDFIKQIHQAYTNSILEKVSKSKGGNL